LAFSFPEKIFSAPARIKPPRDTWLNLQTGLEMEHYFPDPYLGDLFAALNVSAYQSNAFAPDISASWGYLFPQERAKWRLRVGLNFYNCRALSNQFQNRKEKFIAFFVALDV